MYLHIGNNKMIKTGGIIGIFDMDTSTVSQISRDFLRKTEKEGRLENSNEEIPKSFVLTDDTVYTSQISPSRLCGRINSRKNKF